MNNILKAVHFATIAHADQTRKGKPHIPYVTHPLSVGILLAQSGAEEGVIIAGILHDTIEDTDITYTQLEKVFGKEVAEMVNDVTEQDRTLPWVERKRQALDHVAHMRKGSLQVKSADVLHNMTDQLEDYKVLGDKLFERFNASKEQQLERYEKLIHALKKAEPALPLMPNLEDTLAELQLLWK
jgi:(p)ppGpp synthase/HD superfamily hydrolase